MKNHKHSMVVFTMALALAFVPAFAQDIKGPEGDWNLAIDMGGTPMDATLTVTKNSDGTFSGLLDSPMGELSLEKVVYDGGDTLSFSETIGEGDAAMEFSFTGKFLDADTFEGTLVSAMGEMGVKATRVRPAPAIAGTWDIVSESQLGTLERTLVINDDWSGKYIASEDEQFDVTGLAVDGEKVTFAMTLDVQGQEIELTFEGTHDGGTLTGVYMMDGAEAAEVTGTRRLVIIAELIGTWVLDVDSQIGPFTHKLIAAEDGSAQYENEGEVMSEVTNLRKDGDTILFNTTIITGDSAYDLEFEGTIGADGLEGDFFLDGSPVATVTGSKAE